MLHKMNIFNCLVYVNYNVVPIKFCAARCAKLSEQARTTLCRINLGQPPLTKSGVAAALKLCQAQTKLKYKAVLVKCPSNSDVM